MCEKFYDKLQKQLFTRRYFCTRQEICICGAGDKSGQCGGALGVHLKITSTSGVKLVLVCANGPKHQDV